ncbi:putative secreted protein [Streptomyces sp. Tu6071]|nr:putative secreted protein [Streptomyces sp. Tu6071]
MLLLLLFLRLGARGGVGGGRGGGVERAPAVLGGLAHAELLELGEGRGVLGVEPVGEFAEGDAADALLVTDRLDDAFDGAHVGAAVPGLEVVADDHRGAVAPVGAVEGLQEALAHLVAPELALRGVALRRPGLVDQEVVVHRDGLVGVAGHRDHVHREVPHALLLGGPDLFADTAAVVAEAHRPRSGHEVLLAFEARGAPADELLVVVEGERVGLAGGGVGLPRLHELLGLADLAAPVRDGPLADAAALAAEVAVEVGADLVAVQPGPADLVDGVADALEVVEADVGAARGVHGRVVEVLLRAGEHVDPAEEEGHGRVVLLGDLAEVREELLAVLARAVPREDDELGWLLAGLQLLGAQLVRLDAGEGGRAVADEADGVLRGGGGFGLLLLALSPGVIGVVGGAAPAAGQGDGAGGGHCGHRRHSSGGSHDGPPSSLHRSRGPHRVPQAGRVRPRSAPRSHTGRFRHGLTSRTK